MDKADKRLVHRAVSSVRDEGGSAGDRMHIRVQALFMFANIFAPPSPTLTACSSLFIYRFTQLNIVCLCATL